MSAKSEKYSPEMMLRDMKGRTFWPFFNTVPEIFVQRQNLEVIKPQLVKHTTQVSHGYKQ